VLARSAAPSKIAEGTVDPPDFAGAGIDAPYACEMGTCATCETRVLEGIPDHRDIVLSPEERESNKTMMICCSGCIGERLCWTASRLLQAVGD
jgi:vanillate O-demethylase ferredoxin subunit